MLGLVLMRVTRERVLDFVVSRGFAPFATSDIAEALGVKEYSARGAIAWLLIGEYVAIHEWHPSRKHVRLYIWTGKAGAIVSYRRNAEERACQLAEEKSQTAAFAVQDLLNRMCTGVR